MPCASLKAEGLLGGHIAEGKEASGGWNEMATYRRSPARQSLPARHPHSSPRQRVRMDPNVWEVALQRGRSHASQQGGVRQTAHFPRPCVV